MASEKATAEFYLSCALGFEESLAAEIREVWPWLIELNGVANHQPLPEMTLEKGGVLLRTSLEAGLQLNFFLKTPHRILLRLAEFKARDFPKLFEKIQKIPWLNYLATTKIEWEVSAGKSRLNHDKRIAETCSEAFAKSGARSLSGGDYTQAIYVRIYDDLCTVSLDSSGENLHKRGWGTRKGEAPLRETLAAFLLREMIGSASPGELQNITLVDPLCGSGTLLLEAASLWTPTFARDFTFLHWKNTPKILKSPLLKKNYKLLMKATPFAAYRGYDIDEKVLSAAELNLADLRSQTDLPECDIRFEKENLFTDGAAAKGRGSVWCISNPPYGERLHVQGQEVFSYQNLVNRMANKFTAEKVAVLLPDKAQVRSLKAPPGFKKAHQVSFSNGGLEVLFLLFTRN